jgi:hypothetical protein
VLEPAPGNPSGKLRKVAVLSFSTRRLRIQVKAATAGDYLIAVTPKLKGVATARSSTVLTILPPDVSSFSADSVELGEPLTIYGDFFGTKKGKVRIGGVLAKVPKFGWTDTAITVVPSIKTPFGPVAVSITNKAGTGTSLGLEILPPPPKVLPVPLVFQETQVWCWAAAEEMVLHYFGSYYDQCQMATLLAQDLYQNPFIDCCFGFGPYCVNAAPSMQYMQASMYYFGGLDSGLVGPLSFSQIVKQIDRRQPIIVGYQNSFAGHVVVIHGYDLATQSLWIHDSNSGAYMFVPYGVSLSYVNQYIWAQTIIGIHP